MGAATLFPGCAGSLSRNRQRPLPSVPSGPKAHPVSRQVGFVFLATMDVDCFFLWRVTSARRGPRMFYGFEARVPLFFMV